MRKLREMVLEFESEWEIDYLIGACEKMVPIMSEYQGFIDFLESLKEESEEHGLTFEERLDRVDKGLHDVRKLLHQTIDSLKSEPEVATGTGLKESYVRPVNLGRGRSRSSGDRQ